MLRIMKTAMETIALLFFFASLVSIWKISSAVDTIGTNQTLKDGETIVSSEGRFELGFFSPGSSKNRYLGIWYKSILPTMTVVWVANRQVPLVDSSGALKMDNPGILILVDGNNKTLWSTNTTRSTQNAIAQLLESGNFVLRNSEDGDPENFLWQSFDYPCDTLLPEMKLGKNLVTGLEWYLSSWKSSDDPAPGDYTYHCDPTGYPQNVLRMGSAVQYATGPWNGLQFSGTPDLIPNSIYGFGLVFKEKEVYYGYELLGSTISRYVVNESGFTQRWTWINQGKYWDLDRFRPADICDSYAKCGANSLCNTSSPACRCLKKYFVEKNSSAEVSSGCVRRVPLDCNSSTRADFVEYSNVKLPDTRHSWFDQIMTLRECRAVCLRNCSCMAYANLNVTHGGSGCLLWFGDLLNMRYLPENGQDIYIKIASSELGLASSKQSFQDKSQNTDIELPFLDFDTLAKATNDFSTHNLLGEGGFGPVYKGILEGGQEVAVKRLSKSSCQGLDEFKNEVLYIAKLQHRNLVKLLGCCIQGDERMLVYEYLPNNCLESILFDQARSKLLDWPKRLNIIKLVARGLLYLHQDSRLTIIHRDLKASNILLDINMNPKISDFGVARCFGENEIEANTNRVVGTLAYISPEYITDGYFSTKSDVFSFGVLVLEIVTGKRNRSVIHPNHRLNLPGHAWRLFNEGRSVELLGVPLDNSCQMQQALLSIHVGLLCVQQSPEDRPSMSSVVQMLGGESTLAQPQIPGFYTQTSFVDVGYDLTSNNTAISANGLTITLLEGR